MKEKYYIIIFFFAILYFENSFAQSSSFVKEKDNNIDFPVSLNTGTANVNITLFSIDIGGEKIPFTLNYNAVGVKYNQEAGEVGLGWELTPYYRVSWEKRGNTIGKNLTQNQLSSLETLLNNGNQNDRENNLIKFVDKYSLRPLPSFINANNQTTYSDARDLRGEHDLYRYSLPNRSGSLAWLDNDHTKDVVLLNAPPESLKVTEYNRTNNESSLYIADDRGWKYAFGRNPNIDVNYFPIDTIFAPYGEIVTFDYDTYLSPPSDAFHARVNVVEGYNNPPGSYSPKTALFEEIDTIIAFGSYSALFKELKYNNRVVSFFRETDGLLNSITISDPVGTIKVIDFYYSYHDYKDAKFLDSVVINYGAQTYRFEYDDGVASNEAIDLSNNTYAIDHWGNYCLGSEHNAIPGIPASDFMVYNNDGFMAGYVPISTLGTLSQTGKLYTLRYGASYSMFSLKKVTYPGGGSRTFVYEPHVENGIRIKEVIIHDGLGNIAEKKEYSYGASSNYADGLNFDVAAYYIKQTAKIGAVESFGTILRWALYNCYELSNQAIYLPHRSVYYTKVTEQNYDPLGLTGKIDYYYSRPDFVTSSSSNNNHSLNIEGRGLVNRQFPALQGRTNDIAKASVLDSVIYYKYNNTAWQKVKRTVNTYQWGHEQWFYNQHRIPRLNNLYVRQYASLDGWPIALYGTGGLNEFNIYSTTNLNSFFDYGFYTLTPTWIELLKTKTTEYHE